MTKIEDLILRGIMYHEDYMRGVIPHLKEDYFSESHHKVIFNTVKDYIDQYNNSPTKEAIEILVNDKLDVDSIVYDELQSSLKDYLVHQNDPVDKDWLTNETESWCKNQSVKNAIYSCFEIYEGGKNNLTPEAMPEILKDALGVSFDTSIGHDYFDDADARYDYYQDVEQKLPFNLDFFNKVTNNGIPRKTLNLLMGGTGGFKSGTMCSLTSDYLMSGLDVLYITLELAEARVAERIDANLLDTPLDDVAKLDKEDYLRKLNALTTETKGRLKIKEYPTASVHSGHIRHLLNEYILKEEFKPDVIMVDYVNIMCSSRTSMSAGSYSYVKAIAEELRGLAVEHDVVMWTATQTNRSGLDTLDVGLDNMSESMGLGHSVDTIFALMSNEDLAARNQIMIKQLKNRFGDIGKNTKFMVGKDGAKMRLFDCEYSAQDGLNVIVDSSKKKDLEYSGNNTSIPEEFSKTISDKKNDFDNFDVSGLNFN